MTDLMGHLRGLFGINGYQLAMQAKSYSSHLFMYAPLDGVIEPLPPLDDVEISVELQSAGEMTLDFQPGQQEAAFLKVLAYRNRLKIGSCVSWSMGIFHRAPEAQNVLYVAEIEVVEEERGKGLGRYLMAKTHSVFKQRGYRFATLHTGMENYRAQLLYTSMGYRVADTTMIFVKKLDTNL
ncbi:GNAT family N-acetyltransferase [Candidatus Poribacteria bacterium]|nr:GNAT family N-acetyltransferase [Candidatus Poribacteria bacterium]